MIIRYRGRIPRFFEVVGAQKVSDLTPAKASLYVEAMQAVGQAPRSINSELTTVQTMLRWALKMGRIHESPLAYCMKVENRPVKERRPLEDSEIPKLLDASPPHYRRLWVTFLRLRKGELAELRWKDVDLGRGLLHVRSETCKTRREDYIPIAPELDAILRQMRPGRADPETHVFLNQDARPWRNNILRRFKACVKAAKIDPRGLDIHSLRQTYGTMLAADPRNDVRTVMSLMRHRTVAMTMNLYAKPRAMRQREAMRTLDLSSRGKLQTSSKGAVSQVKKA